MGAGGSTPTSALQNKKKVLTMAKGKYQEWLEPDGLLRLEGWARDGLTDEQIARKAGINPATLYKWIERFPEIGEAIKKGKGPVDFEVENALLKRALGYTVTISKPIKVKTKKQLKDKGTIEEERVEYVDEEIYIAPDTTAQIFWLKNRRRSRWCDKPVIKDEDETVDDGFLAALNGTAAEDWQGGDDAP